jgi:hypothetical protein
MARFKVELCPTSLETILRDTQSVFPAPSVIHNRISEKDITPHPGPIASLFPALFASIYHTE